MVKAMDQGEALVAFSALNSLSIQNGNQSLNLTTTALTRNLSTKADTRSPGRLILPAEVFFDSGGQRFWAEGSLRKTEPFVRRTVPKLSFDLPSTLTIGRTQA